MTTGAARGTQLLFSVEGLGVGSANRVYFFATGPAPSWDSDGAWVPCWTPFPGEIETEVNFDDGTSTIGGLSLTIRATQTTQGLFYDQSRVKIADLTSALTSSATSITLDQTTLAGQTIVVGRECIYLSSHTGGGTYNCARARLGTTKRSHGIGARDYTAVFNAADGPILRWRQVTLYRCNMSTATSYNDLETLWTGVLYSVSAPSPEIIQIEADSMLSVLERMKICENLWRGEVDPRPNYTGRNLRQYIARGEGVPVYGTSSALYSVDDATVVETAAITPSTGGAAVYFTEHSRYYLDAVRTPRIPEDPKEVWECFHCTGDDSDPGSLPLSRNLLTLLLQVLTTTPEGNNGSYDLGIEDLGCAIPQGYVDIAGIVAVREEMGDLLDQDRLFLAVDGDPVEVLDWFRPKLLAYGIVIVDTGTQISVAWLQDNAVLVSTSISEGAAILGPASTPERDPPVQTRRMDLSFDSVRAEIEYRPGEGTKTKPFYDVNRRRINIFGDNAAREADLGGVDETKAFGIARLLIERFHDDIPQIELWVKRDQASSIAVGSLIKITHSKLYVISGGTRSITAETFLVTARRIEYGENTMWIKALHVGGLYDQPRLIAPAAVVDSWDGGTSTLTLEDDYDTGGFQSGLLDFDPYNAPVDLSDFASGDIVDLCNSKGVVQQANLEIDTIDTGTGQVTFVTTITVTPSAGWIMRMADYANCVSRQTARYAYLANSSGIVGVGSDAGATYTL